MSMESPVSIELTDNSALEQVFPEYPELVELLKGREIKLLQISNSEGSEEKLLISFEHSQELPHTLPEGYGYEGGAARYILLKELHQKAMYPRDFDVVGFSEFGADVKHKEELSTTVMREDYTRSGKQYGAEVTSFAKYFWSRDFTLNEITVVGNRIYLSLECISDLMDKIVRPTEYEKYAYGFGELLSVATDNDYDDEQDEYEYERYGLDPKLVMKALRLQEEFLELYGEGMIIDIEDWQWEPENLPLFHVALSLNKAYQTGDQIAQRVFETIMREKMVDEHITGKTPRELAESIDEALSINGRPFIYEKDFVGAHVRDIPEIDWEKEYREWARSANVPDKEIEG